jgi:hypothetical protein
MRSCAAFAHLVFSNGSSGKRKVKSIGHLRPPTISPEPPEDADHLGPVGRAENSLAFVHKHGKHLVQYLDSRQYWYEWRQGLQKKWSQLNRLGVNSYCTGFCLNSPGAGYQLGNPGLIQSW